MNRVILGKVVSPIGLSGMFKCLLYSHPPTWTDKSALMEIGGINREVVLVKYPYNSKPNSCSCATKVISSREQVHDIIGKEFWINRSELAQAEENEYYCHDLIGLPIFRDSEEIGKLSEVHDFGTGTIFKSSLGEYIHSAHLDKVVQSSTSDEAAGLYLKGIILEK